MNFFTYLICLFLFVAPPINARGCDVIRVGCAKNWYPVAFMLTPENTQATGVAVEIIKLAAKELGLKVTMDCSIPWKRLTMYMDTGEIDAIAGHYMTKQRQRDWLVSKAIIEDDILVIYKINHQKITSINDLNDLHGLIGAIHRGANYGQKIDDFIKQQQAKNLIVETHLNDSIFSLIRYQRVDYGFISKNDATEKIKRYGFVDEITLSKSIDVNTVHIAFSKHSACAVYFNQFNQLISQFKSTKVIDKLLTQY